MVKTVGKYQIGKTLGEGTFGKVKFAMNTETGESVAIKVLDKEKIQKQSMGAQVRDMFDSRARLVTHCALRRRNCRSRGAGSSTKCCSDAEGGG